MAKTSLDQVLAALEALRHDMQAEIDGLKAEIEGLKTRQTAAETKAEEVPEVSAETLVILAAAATTYLGKKVRVRSAKMLQTPYEIVNPWAQHGRVFVQASHHLPRSRQ